MDTQSPTRSPSLSPESYAETLGPIYVTFMIIVLVMVLICLWQRCLHFRNVTSYNVHTSQYLGEQLKAIYLKKKAEHSSNA